MSESRGSSGLPPENPQRAAKSLEAEADAQVNVTHREAAILAEDFPDFDSVTIRQCLEFEPLKQAMELLEYAEGADDPTRALKDRAKSRQTGYYRPRHNRSSAEEEHERYLAFLRERWREARERGENGLRRTELEELTYEFYAPAYRAEIENAIPEQVESYYRELSEGGDGVAWKEATRRR